MKCLLVVLLLSTNAWASQSVSLEIPDGPKGEKIEILQDDNGAWTLKKNSTALTPQDQRLGVFKLTDTTKLRELAAKLSKVQKTIEGTRKVIAEQDPTLVIEQDEKSNHHTPFVKLNGDVFTVKSPHYNDIGAVVREFIQLPMTQTDGLQLDNAQKKLTRWEAGKVIQEMEYDVGTFCEGDVAHLKCTSPLWGTFHLAKK